MFVVFSTVLVLLFVLVVRIKQYMSHGEHIFSLPTPQP
jgi:hypothetical protein